MPITDPIKRKARLLDFVDRVESQVCELRVRIQNLPPASMTDEAIREGLFVLAMVQLAGEMARAGQDIGVPGMEPIKELLQIAARPRGSGVRRTNDEA